MPKKKLLDEENYVDPGIVETVRPYANLKMRIPADARMSENIEDRRGDAFMYGNKLAMQKTRGKRMAEDEKFLERPAAGPYEEDIGRTAKTARMNARLLEPGMTPSGQRDTLERGEEAPEYQARARAREQERELRPPSLEEFLRDISSGSQKTRADRDAMQELVDRETRGYAKGGMVTKKNRGDGICTRGHTKGRMY
jgi:hypothetical protein